MFLIDIQHNRLASFASKEKKKKRDLTQAAISTASAGYIGQRTIRSGIPRLLGVRLESHSTNKKTANEILKNGGILDPNKSGASAIRALEINPEGVGTDINKAKNKVYVTGVHKNAIARDMPNPQMPLTMIKVDPKKENPLTQVLNRAQQRRGYRGQSTVDWDKVYENKPRMKELEKSAKTGMFGGKYFSDDALRKEYDTLANQTKKRFTEERANAALRGALPTTGRSLYIGGSDKFFNENFKPDFDDPRAMYSEKKIRVYGNRFKAVGAAIKEEGLLKLMKSNPKRVLAGAAILGLGGLATAASAKTAVTAATGDVKVKGFYRKGKAVKGYQRKRKPRK
jgi:hypothetical protein